MWMKTVHIPDVMHTGLFTENKLCRLITEDESEITYAIQYHFRNMNNMHTYQKEFASKLQQDHREKFKDKFAAFRTILEIV